MQKKAAKQISHKKRILDAAATVFLAIGFEKTSTAEIARVAKISKREMYLHFSDKRALLAAVVEDLQADMQNRMDDVWSSADALEDVLFHSAKSIQQFILSERFGKLVRIVAAESYHSPNIAQQFFDTGPSRGRMATARYMKEQMHKKHLRSANPMKAADDFLNLVVGAQMMTAVILGVDHPAMPTPATTRHAVEVFLMIYGSDASPRTVSATKRSTR